MKIRYYITTLLRNPLVVLPYLGTRELLNWIPDRIYLKMVYYSAMRKRLNLNHPVTYNEKLQWIKLYDRNPDHIQLVDKYEVRKYVEDKIGPEYLIPIHGVFTSADAINPETLPDAFVLKCTHGCGCNIFCRDKRQFDLAQAKKRLNRWLKRNYYWGFREWHYKHIEPRILCEELLLDGANVPSDIKIMCFNGEPEIIQVHKNRFTNHEVNYYNLDWEWVEMKIGDYPHSNEKDPKPANLDEMIRVARKLSSGLKQIRVDLYSLNGRIYFGELTFFNAAGIIYFEPDSMDRYFGDKILNVPE